MTNKITEPKRNSKHPRGQYAVKCQLIDLGTKEVIDWWEDYEYELEDAEHYFVYLTNAHKKFDYSLPIDSY